ncbi:MAG: Dihydroorotate dehydrogenase B (NAD(+)), electron transfer subunit [Planctomycetes bacterium ADurb.Bin412]|nr:MAG: Dihydroorotate dehydrogenase B (NAD(+)), electron transfer subunit [Planctomycetes bacterium ADurb.Bin412]
MGNSIGQTPKMPRRGEFTARVADQIHLGDGNNSLLLALAGQPADCLAQAKAGQFIQVACRDLNDFRQTDPLLRRPFSIAGISKNYQQLRPHSDAKPAGFEGLFLEIIYRVLGPGTAWLSRQKAGDSINLLGPLGNGFSLPGDPNEKVILIGGGVGLPPLYFLADQLSQAGFTNLLGFAGARTKSHFETAANLAKLPSDPLIPAAVLEPFARSKTDAILATEDRSIGFPGSIVQALEMFLQKRSDWNQARIYTCGPKGMLKAVADLARRHNLAGQVCMENYMSCGIGLCQSCVVAVKTAAAEPDGTAGKYKLVCSNGPVFDMEKIIWD